MMSISEFSVRSRPSDGPVDGEGRGRRPASPLPWGSRWALAILVAGGAHASPRSHRPVDPGRDPAAEPDRGTHDPDQEEGVGTGRRDAGDMARELRVALEAQRHRTGVERRLVVLAEIAHERS